MKFRIKKRKNKPDELRYKGWRRKKNRWKFAHFGVICAEVNCKQLAVTSDVVDGITIYYCMGHHPQTRIDLEDNRLD